MLSGWKIVQIERMLREDGLSQRETARRCGVSRGTVRSVALGQRCRRPPKPDGFQDPDREPQRCPECGGRVRMPCLGCEVLRMLREGKIQLRCSGIVLSGASMREEGL